ncbi:MAG: DUF6798 domain-containing protein [Bryobacterales bacterium]|nr:DUF6798 domain-containing protein [Bryobacterales bacterium]
MGNPHGRAEVATALRYREHIPAIPGLLAILIVGFSIDPGRHFLTSDTQIWTVMMEHQLHPEFLGRDLLAQYPHIGLSFYDEIVNGLRRLTGLPVEAVMVAHQVVFRAVMLGAAYWLGFALCKSRLLAVWMAASIQMIYFIAGPTVCVFEVEPVPRAYSLALGLLAVALVANGRRWGAAWALGAAMLFQAVMVYPLLLCLASWTLFSREDGSWRRRLSYWVPIAGLAIAVVTLSIAAQGGSGGMFAIVPEWLREVQRVRASYNWVSLWPWSLLAVHLLLCVAAGFSYFRLRADANPWLRWFLWGVPIVALCSIPVAWLMMERLHLMVAAQTQPARALAMMYAVGVVALLSAGVLASNRGRWMECGFWLLCGYSMVFLDRTVAFSQVLAAGEGVHGFWLWAPALATAATGILWLRLRSPVAATILFGLLMASPFAIYRLHFDANVMAQDARTPEVLALSAWAEANTHPDAVFLFPGFERSIQPGVFRSVARRALYVDWKAGGQVNFDIEFARLWWQRWNQAGKGKFTPSRAALFAREGIDYLVVPRAAELDLLAPLYRNSRFVVYRTADVARCAELGTCSVRTASR